MSRVSWVSGLPLRLRLTLAYASGVALLLTAIGVFVFQQEKAGLDAELDRNLRGRAIELAPLRSDLRRLGSALEGSGRPGQLIGADGRVLASLKLSPTVPTLDPRRLRAARDHEISFERGERLRILAHPVGGGAVLVFATSISQRERTLETLARVLLIGGPLTLLLISAAGYAVAAGALRPVERMRREAAEISDPRVDTRLPLPRSRDELRRLGETLNQMLSRIGAASAHERAFLATASHELRTPLAILKAELELALDPDAQPEEWRETIVSASEETDRLIRLAEDLLLVARGEEAGPEIRRARTQVSGLAKDVAARVAAVHPSLEIAVETDPQLCVEADRDGLARALTNLVENARRHGAAPIEITTRVDGNWVEVHVIDHGPGFCEDYLARAFERFSRAADARGGGAGLGLAIVEAIAHAHGGSAGAANAEGGADVWLRLPLAAPATASSSG